MKSYTKKMLSLTSSLLIAAQQCFIAMPAGAVYTPSEAENYAQSIGLELNSSNAEEALSDLIDINDKDLAVAVDDNNNVTQINGVLSDETVDNSNDAKDIIAKTSELLGIDNVNREIRLSDVSESEYNRIYTFKQFYQGLEMVNSYITVVVDKETGEADYLNSSVVSDFSINTTPSITAQQAIDAVAEKIGQNNVSSHKLVIYSEDNETFKLAWAISGDFIGQSVYYVDAANGDILNNKINGDTPDNGHTVYYNSILLDWNNKILPESAYSFDVDVATANGKYTFHDTKRNLYVISSPSWYAYWRGNICYTRLSSSSLYAVETTDSSFSSELDQYSAACLYNVERVYDYFKNTFNYVGYDGKNNTMYIVPTLKVANSDGTNKQRWDNACSCGNTLSFGEGDGYFTNSFASDLDTIAHEFAHSLTGSIVNWGPGDGETGSLNEAYSDIFGEYCDTTREWQLGTDLYINNTNKNTSNKKKYCIRDLSIRNNYSNSDDFAEVECHYGSKVISHAAYWMDKLGIDAATGEKIWFASLDYLPKGYNAAKFIDCRNAVLQAIDDVAPDNKKNEYKIKAKTAFNRVHVYDPNEIPGDLCKDGALNAFDLTILRQVVAGTRSLPLAQRAQADLNYDFKINQKDIDILSKYILGEISEF